MDFLISDIDELKIYLKAVIKNLEEIEDKDRFIFGCIKSYKDVLEKASK